MNELALFAGAGGGILGGKLLGWRTICAVEWDPYARDVLVARQNDGSLDPFPIWSDIQSFDGKPWRGRAQVVSGGFPCQDIAAPGAGAGIDGKRSGMWFHMARIIGEVLPRFVFVENSPLLVRRGLGRVLGDLSSMGYDCRWGIVGARHTGAPHKRDRLWIFADSDRDGLEGWHDCNQKRPRKSATGSVEGFCESKIWDGLPAPDAFGTSNGLAARMDRTEKVGNGQVPAVVRLAWNLLAVDDLKPRLDL